jgi:glycosyltransferase involved in cell wall biosynthesis
VTATLRRLRTAPSRALLGAYVPARTASWPASSRLFVVGDELGWSIDDDRARLIATAERLGYDVAPSGWALFARNQALFHHNHFAALQPRWLDLPHRLGLSYFHGRPGTPGYPEFDRAYELLRRNASRIDRVQVTHRETHALVVAAGVDPSRVFRIPIGVDIARFPLGDQGARAASRATFGIPESAFVVGSFVKDGVGMDDGLEPKLVKGPDTLVATVGRLRPSVPELLILLTGPARGFVRNELQRLNVPYRHVHLQSRDELASAYHAVDVQLVTSRQEGGPKSVFEAMAAGVPVVTTHVGQAAELVVDGENGLLADVDDVERLAEGVTRLREDSALRGRLRAVGRMTAEAYADERLDARWAELLEGFVRRAD